MFFLFAMFGNTFGDILVFATSDLLKKQSFGKKTTMFWRIFWSYAGTPSSNRRDNFFSNACCATTALQQILQTLVVRQPLRQCTLETLMIFCRNIVFLADRLLQHHRVGKRFANRLLQHQRFAKRFAKSWRWLANLVNGRR